MNKTINFFAHVMATGLLLMAIIVVVPTAAFVYKAWQLGLWPWQVEGVGLFVLMPLVSAGTFIVGLIGAVVSAFVFRK